MLFEQFISGHLNCKVCERQISEGRLCETCCRHLPLVEQACERCGDERQSAIADSKVCGRCLGATSRQKAVMAFWYRPPIDEWVVRYKFHQDWCRGADMVSVLLKRIRLTLPADSIPNILLPVPMHKRRLRQRGYNPAIDIARQLGRTLSVKVDVSFLEKQTATTPQVELPYRLRIKNVRNSFKLCNSDLPSHVAIVDDVVTTGATVEEIARLLRNARPNIRISIWALARAVKNVI